MVLVLCFRVGSASADPYKPSISVQNRKLAPITFSRIVVRLSANEIGVEGNHLRIQFLETLRRLGYPARGAESLVFDRDDSNQARFVLGGTASEMQCGALSPRTRRCWLGVTWEVLDREQDRVTYRAHTRHAAQGDDPQQVADELVWGTFYSLLSRQSFVTALSGKSRYSAAKKPSFPSATYLRCSRAEAAMPGSADTLMKATVVVKAGERMGSGTLVSSEGFVLTAAHVVDGQTDVYVQPRDGAKVAADVIRLDPHADVALLKARSGSGYPCIDTRADPVTAGEDLFAIGSPVAQELAFTLTRGVVSGVRTLDGVSLVQTDASINRGNSGGPLLDSKGKLVGVVSWKIVESGVEGIAFGISTQSALNGLSLVPADRSDAILSHRADPASATPATGVDDVADPVPVLAPSTGPPSAPGFVPAGPKPDVPRGPKSKRAKLVGTIGLITAGAGVVGVGVTYGIYEGKKDTLRQDGFDGLRLANDIAWVTIAAGAGTFAISELMPREKLPVKAPPKKKASRKRVELSFGIGPGVAVLRGAY